MDWINITFISSIGLSHNRDAAAAAADDDVVVNNSRH